MPVAVYITVWDGTSAPVKQMEGRGLSKGVLLIVLSIKERAAR